MDEGLKKQEKENKGIRTGTVDFFYNLYGDWTCFYLKANPWIRSKSMSYDIFKSIKPDTLSKWLFFFDNSQCHKDRNIFGTFIALNTVFCVNFIYDIINFFRGMYDVY